MFEIEVVGVNETISAIDKYAAETERKFYRVLERLGEIGLTFLEVGLVSYDQVEPENFIHVDGSWISKNIYAISLSGEDVTFFEFGTGVYNPPYQDPSIAEQFGAFRGEYGLGKGKNKKWSYYDSTGNKVVTSGFATDHNLYGSAREMRQSIARVIQEVFK